MARQGRSSLVDTRAHMTKLTETREITPYLWVHPHLLNHAREVGDRLFVDGRRLRPFSTADFWQVAAAAVSLFKIVPQLRPISATSFAEKATGKVAL